MLYVFNALTGAVSIYILLCFLRIIMTWFPNMMYSAAGRFLAAVCDPYLNLFRRLRFLRFGMIDFSPAVAVGVLVALSSVLTQASLLGTFRIGFLLGTLLGVCWSVFASLLGLVVILIVVRLVVAVFWPNAASQLWQALDRTLYPIVFKMTEVFFGRGKYVQFRTALLIALAALVVVLIAGGYLINFITALCMKLPF